MFSILNSIFKVRKALVTLNTFSTTSRAIRDCCQILLQLFSKFKLNDFRGDKSKLICINSLHFKKEISNLILTFFVITLNIIALDIFSNGLKVVKVSFHKKWSFLLRSFSNKYKQILSFMEISLQLLKKSLMENATSAKCNINHYPIRP